MKGEILQTPLSAQLTSVVFDQMDLNSGNVSSAFSFQNAPSSAQA